MADLAPTAANVGLTDDSANTQLSIVIAGAAVAQSEPKYLSSTDGRYYSADADDIDQANAKGIAMSPAATGEYFILATDGPIDLGVTLTVGETYVVSTTSGKVAPIGDLTTGDYVTILGTATETDTLVLAIKATNTPKP